MKSFDQFESIIIWTEPVDFRKGLPYFISLISSQMEMDPLDPSVLYLFTNRRHKKLKAVWFDGSEPWIASRDQEDGTYKWPSSTESGIFRASLPELLNLLGD